MPQVILSAYKATAGLPSDDGDDGDGDYGLLWHSNDDSLELCENLPGSHQEHTSSTQDIALDIPQDIRVWNNPLSNPRIRP